MTSIALKDRGETERGKGPDMAFVKDGMRLPTRTFWSVCTQRTQLRNGNLKVRRALGSLAGKVKSNGFRLINLVLQTGQHLSIAVSIAFRCKYKYMVNHSNNPTRARPLKVTNYKISKVALLLQVGSNIIDKIAVLFDDPLCIRKQE